MLDIHGHCFRPCVWGRQQTYGRGRLLVSVDKTAFWVPLLLILPRHCLICAHARRGADLLRRGGTRGKNRIGTGGEIAEFGLRTSISYYAFALAFNKHNPVKDDSRRLRRDLC
jgi:hypothetical protein